MKSNNQRLKSVKYKQTINLPNIKSIIGFNSPQDLKKVPESSSSFSISSSTASAPSSSIVPTTTNSIKKSNKIVTGAEEWLAWCSENKVLVGQTIELTHYEIESCRRYFSNLKFHPSDEGVHPKTLADSFYRAEVFPTFNEALLFCQKLGKNSDSLLTFTDLLNCVHGTSIFKRNKVTSFMKFVASSEVFDFVNPSITELSSADTPSTTNSTARRASKPDNIYLKNRMIEKLDSIKGMNLGKDQQQQQDQNANQGIIINKHTSTGSEITVQSRKKSLERQDSSEQYRKFILKRSYTRSESSDNLKNNGDNNGNNNGKNTGNNNGNNNGNINESNPSSPFPFTSPTRDNDIFSTAFLLYI